MRALLYYLREGFSSAAGAIRQNKLRALLTTLGIVIGIVMVTSTFTTINGMERAFDRSLAMLGTNTLYVQRWPWFTSPSEWWKYQRRPDITRQDAERIAARVTANARYVKAIAPEVQTGAGRLQYRDALIRGIFVQASTPAITDVAEIDLTAGRYYNDLDERTARPVLVIGAEVKTQLFPNEEAVGKTVRLDGQRFEVIGVLARQGKFLGLFSFDEQVQMPLGTFRRTFGEPGAYQLSAAAVSADDLGRAQDELTGLVRAARGLDATEEDDFSINRTEAFREALAATKATIYGVGLFLTTLALVVGGIGVMNIMFVSVKERTREIGIRKALGAPRRAILLQFLLEAILVCCLGGAIGVVLAALVTLAINAFFTAVLSPAIVVLAFVICVLVGVVFGLLPAWRASRANPIEALRYE